MGFDKHRPKSIFETYINLKKGICLSEAYLSYKNGRATEYDKNFTIKAASGPVDFSFVWDGDDDCTGPFYETPFWTENSKEFDSLIETMVVIIGKEVVPWMKENEIANFSLNFATDDDAGLPLQKSLQKHISKYGRKYGFNTDNEKGDMNVNFFQPAEEKTKNSANNALEKAKKFHDNVLKDNLKKFYIPIDNGDKVSYAKAELDAYSDTASKFPIWRDHIDPDVVRAWGKTWREGPSAKYKSQYDYGSMDGWISRKWKNG